MIHVFFHSDPNGVHMHGSAAKAYVRYGATPGVVQGRQGKAYAIYLGDNPRDQVERLRDYLEEHGEECTLMRPGKVDLGGANEEHLFQWCIDLLPENTVFPRGMKLEKKKEDNCILHTDGSTLSWGSITGLSVYDAKVYGAGTAGTAQGRVYGILPFATYPTPVSPMDAANASLPSGYTIEREDDPWGMNVTFRLMRGGTKVRELGGRVGMLSGDVLEFALENLQKEAIEDDERQASAVIVAARSKSSLRMFLDKKYGKKKP